MTFPAPSAERCARRHGPVALLSLAALLAGCTGSEPAAGPGHEAEIVAGTVHVCSSCHGQDGRSVSPTFPNLAGQQKEYLVAQLKAFRDKTRADPHARTYMFGMAARLDDALIDGLATYFSRQKPAEPTPGDPAEIKAGAAIVADGIDAQGIPACSACHGEKAEGAGAIPRLASQHPEYLENQLEAFQTMARANQTMHDNSKNLTPDQIRQVAAYLAAQP